MEQQSLLVSQVEALADRVLSELSSLQASEVVQVGQFREIKIQPSSPMPRATNGTIFYPIHEITCLRIASGLNDLTDRILASNEARTLALADFPVHEQPLLRFVKLFSEAHLNRDINAGLDLLERMVVALTPSATKVYQTSLLSGLIIDDQIEFDQLGHSVILRPINVSEFERYVNTHMFQTHPKTPTSTLTIRTSPDSPNAYPEVHDGVMNLLRLMLLRPVERMLFYRESTGISPLEFGVGYPGTTPDIDDGVPISHHDLTRLKVLLSAPVVSRLHNTRKSSGHKGKGKDVKASDLELPLYVSRSLDLFRKCLPAGPIQDDTKIARAVAALEALLTENRPEMSYRLQKRSATMLKILDVDPHYCEDILSVAYEIRSKYVHGDEVSDKVWKKAEKAWLYKKSVFKRSYTDTPESIDYRNFDEHRKRSANFPRRAKHYVC